MKTVYKPEEEVTKETINKETKKVVFEKCNAGMYVGQGYTRISFDMYDEEVVIDFSDYAWLEDYNQIEELFEIQGSNIQYIEINDADGFDTDIDEYDVNVCIAYIKHEKQHTLKLEFEIAHSEYQYSPMFINRRTEKKEK